jgi:hypothetical protein
MYGRIYIPTGKLDALYSTRLSPTMQALVAAISDTPGRGLQRSNVMFSLQHDVGRTCTEYSWSAEDSMWGVRVLHNFGRMGEEDEKARPQVAKAKRIDEEEAMEGGLKGRISAGAELYFSAKEKSAGCTSLLGFLLGPLITISLYSIDWYPLHHSSGCNSTFFPAAFQFGPSPHTWFTPGTLATSYDHHGAFQSYVGPHVWSVCGAGFPRLVALLPIRFQRVLVRE